MTSDSGSVATLMAFFATYFFVILAIVVLQVVWMWKVYSKAGKPGWASIVPIYSQYVLFEIVGMNGWYAFLVFIPFVGSIIVAIMNYIALYKLAICFGKDSGFGIGMIFLPFIFGLMLAFGDAKYNAPVQSAN